MCRDLSSAIKCESSFVEGNIKASQLSEKGQIKVSRSYMNIWSSYGDVVRGHSWLAKLEVREQMNDRQLKSTHTRSPTKVASRNVSGKSSDDYERKTRCLRSRRLEPQGKS